MRKEFKFRTSKKLLAILFFLLFIILSLWLLSEPEKFIRNQFMKKSHILLLGGVGLLSSFFYLCSFVMILPSKIAIVITKDYLVDNSRYESLGKIYWSEIYKIKRLNKNSIQITFKDLNLKNRKISILKRILLFLTNWNYKESVIISSALLDCSIDELEKAIRSGYLKRNR